MREMKVKKAQKIMLGLNVAVVLFIFATNYVYQSHGFDFTLKCVCSGSFCLLGLANLVYAIVRKEENIRYYISMALGLFLAFLGDVLIGYDFIVGAATFALGHVCFVVAYGFLQKIRRVDVIMGGLLFASATAFLLFCPLLQFDVPIFRIVCIVYALIISTMLGKAIGNLIAQKSLLNGMIALASALFFFSDLMLVFDWFIGFWDWTSNACMGTYYPALCFLALCMLLKTLQKKNV